MRSVTAREGRWWRGVCRGPGAGRPLGRRDGLRRSAAGPADAGYGDGREGARIWLEDCFAQHGWLEPGPTGAFTCRFRCLTSAPTHTSSAEPTTGARVVDRVVRIARNHLVERFGDDPFDGDELVLRDDHMVEHEVAWAVPFVRRSRLDHPTLHNVLFVNPVIIPKDTRFAPSPMASRGPRPCGTARELLSA